jgi:hypothetical protein
MSQPPLFGLVPAGQPVITSPTETPSPTSFLFAIPAATGPGAKPFSHLVVFLLPGVALPPDCAAAIYLVTPGGQGVSTKFLGGIGPGKESAIFNISGGAAASSSSTSSTISSNVVIGVSLEPAESVAQRIQEKTATTAAANNKASSTALAPPSAGGQPSTLVLAQRIIKNAFNFLSSYSQKAGGVEVVPLKAFEEWWRKFESRLRSDPSFLERDED